MSVLVINSTPLQEPYAPTLLSPPSGIYEDLAGTPASGSNPAIGPTFAWQYNPLVLGNQMTNWLFCVNIVTGTGLPVIAYWNAETGAFQTAPSYNPLTGIYGTLTNTGGNQWSYTFPYGAFQDGDVVQWSIAIQDVNPSTSPPLGGVSPFSQFFLVNAQVAPTVSNINITSGTAAPEIQWQPFIASQATQTTYRVCLYTLAQTEISGFQPGVSPSLYDTNNVGDQYANILQLSTVPLYLYSDSEYFVYIQISQTGGQFSQWYGQSFTPSYTPPQSQPITAVTSTDPTTANPGCPRITLTVGETPTGNILSVDDANPTLGVGTWHNAENCVVTSDPTYGLVLTPTGTNFTASTGFYAVTPNTTYTLTFTLYSSGAGEYGVGFVEGFTSGYVFTNGYAITGVTDQTFPTPTTSIVTFTTGPDDAFVEALVSYPYAGTIPHYVQEIGIIEGTVDAWEPGGGGGSSFTGNVIIERSDGAYVRNASLSNPAVVTDGTLTIYDYEAIPTVDYQYTAWILDTSTPGIYKLSQPTTSDSVMLTTSGWWEIEPNVPANSTNAQVINWTGQVTEQSTAHLVLGQPTPNVVASVMGKLDGTATFETFDPATYQNLSSLLQSQSTIFVSSPWGPVDTTYARFGPQTGGLSGGTGTQVKQSDLLPSTFANMHRTTDVTWVAQPRPPV